MKHGLEQRWNFKLLHNTKKKKKSCKKPPKQLKYITKAVKVKIQEPSGPRDKRRQRALCAFKMLNGKWSEVGSGVFHMKCLINLLI